ncbi:MAG: hypothetical protein KGP27_16650 [Hyphomicrobiales bacterium]|nr:hypothetical protein [Hyphomicrobiales bacterium]
MFADQELKPFAVSVSGARSGDLYLPCALNAIFKAPQTYHAPLVHSGTRTSWIDPGCAMVPPRESRDWV